MTAQMANHEIVTLALFLCGGEIRYVDLEDVAVKSNELAPRRFTWRKYKDQINIKNVGAFLHDARKGKYGALVTGSEKEGWMLTQNGCQFCRERLPVLDKANLSIDQRLTPKERQRITRERERIRTSDTFLKAKRRGTAAVSMEEAERLFRLNAYITGQSRKDKITRILNVFRNDSELGGVVKELAEFVLRGCSNDK